MSPLIFLAIPLVIFFVGSGLLYLGSRWNEATARYRKAPADLRAVAPMLQEQRESGWTMRSGHHTRR